MRASREPDTRFWEYKHAVSSRIVGVAFVVLAAVCFSTKAIFAKLAYSYDVDARTVLSLRMAFALPFFAVSAWRAERFAQMRIGRADVLRMLAIGCGGYYLAAWLDFLGLQYISASLERLIIFLYPTLVVALNFLFYRERPPRGIALALLLSYGGVALSVSGASVGTKTGPSGLVLGSCLVFGSAMAYALYLSGSQPLITRYGSGRVTSHVLVVACLCVLVEFVANAPLSQLVQPWQVVCLGASTGLIATVVPAFALTAGIARIGASRASVLGSVGPVATLFLSWLVLNEAVGLRDVLGCAMVLLGVAYMSRSERTGRIA